MREVVLDTETTGLDYTKGDRIIEVGCVELINHLPTGNSFQFYCSTSKKISEEAQNVHGLSNEFLKKFPDFRSQAKNFLDFIKKDKLIIHNAKFDVGFINNELKISGLDKIDNEVVDTTILARKVLGTRLVNLDFLCRKFSIDIEKRKLHGALLDSQLLSEVYLELVGGRQTSMSLLNNKNQQLKKEDFQKQKKTNHVKKINITEEEIKKHKEFLSKIQKPVWLNFKY